MARATVVLEKVVKLDKSVSGYYEPSPLDGLSSPLALQGTYALKEGR